jgi:cobalt-factor II C20-methyltransferase (EC 2.1.1.151)
MPRLYVVGLGPGDPELVTVKAAETLRRASIVFLPYSTGTNRSLAHSIVARYIGDAEVVFLGFPMGRDPEREVLVENARVVCHGVRRRGPGSSRCWATRRCTAPSTG